MKQCIMSNILFEKKLKIYTTNAMQAEFFSNRKDYLHSLFNAETDL